MKEKFFNPLRNSHLVFTTELEKELSSRDEKVTVYKFGDSTQHIFLNDIYWMTVDWKKI